MQALCISPNTDTLTVVAVAVVLAVVMRERCHRFSTALLKSSSSGCFRFPSRALDACHILSLSPRERGRSVTRRSGTPGFRRELKGALRDDRSHPALYHSESEEAQECYFQQRLLLHPSLGADPTLPSGWSRLPRPEAIAIGRSQIGRS